MSGLVIVGTGHAGLTLAREWRKLDDSTPLTLITADDGAAYYKPNISKALASGKSADELITATPESLADDLNARVLTATRISGIDVDARTLSAGDDRIAFDRLVLATGARCIEVPIDGAAADRVLHVNSLQDYREFRADLADGARVLIIGGGLIGCEFANDLIATGYGVDVVDPLAWPLGRLLPQAQGEALRDALAALGVGWHLQTTVSALDSGDGCLVATLADGSRVEADVVLSAVGLTPDTRLAEAAGLNCQRGIVVDEFFAAVPDTVYALGDAVEFHGLVRPYILPIANAARALAKTLAGDPTAVVYPVMPVMVKTPACPTVVAPPAAWDGDWDVEGEAPDLTARYRNADGEVTGFALTGAATKQRGVLAKEVNIVI